MDRPTTRTEAFARASRFDPDEAPVLPSRRPALDLCRAALGLIGDAGVAQCGPALLTGDAGVGKTWLWRQLRAESPPGRRWVAVDLTPSDDPIDFYRLVAHELGIDDLGSKSPTSSRVGLVEFLATRQADGERINLVVEEAHNLSPLLWEEVRVLANRLDSPGGFASMILVGQTPLAIRFSTRPFAAIEARLSSRVHLGPIGVDEAKDLLDRVRPGRTWSDDEVEILHRDASGNPRRLLRLAGPNGAIVDQRIAERTRMALEPLPKVPDVLDRIETTPPAVKARDPIASPMPLTGPARPPIRVEENMIEVGWSPEDTSTPDPGYEESTTKIGPSTPSQGGEEAVRDHYAALQAWREWSENQARRTPKISEIFEDELEDEIDEEDEPVNHPSPRLDRPALRAEGEQKFAPFGQLFSKMAQAIEPE